MFGFFCCAAAGKVASKPTIPSNRCDRSFKQRLVIEHHPPKIEFLTCENIPSRCPNCVLNLCDLPPRGRLLTRTSRHHATETEMIGACTDLTLSSRSDHVARAILIGAKERTAPHDSFGHTRFCR